MDKLQQVLNELGRKYEGGLFVSSLQRYAQGYLVQFQHTFDTVDGRSRTEHRVAYFKLGSIDVKHDTMFKIWDSICD